MLKNSGKVSAIVLENINRSFGERQVLKDVSFKVAAGRMTGFVGGNGAGKTTTMRIILGVLAKDSGEVLMHGDPLTRELHAKFGYMPEERGLYPKMKVLEQLVYLARLHGLDKNEATQSASSLVERLGLQERANDTLESLSLGNQQRAQIAAALVHKPIALVLDEPFSGLDPMAVEVVLGVLRDFAADGAPVLFSSHQLDIVERLCDDIVVIADGEIRASGPKEDLRAAHSSKQYEILFTAQQKSTEPQEAPWQSIPGVTKSELRDGRLVFEAENIELAQKVLQAALKTGNIAGFNAVRPTITEIFKEVVK